jgi:hypothetical protein
MIDLFDTNILFVHVWMKTYGDLSSVEEVHRIGFMMNIEYIDNL